VKRDGFEKMTEGSREGFEEGVKDEEFARQRSGPLLRLSKKKRKEDQNGKKAKERGIERCRVERGENGTNLEVERNDTQDTHDQKHRCLLRLCFEGKKRRGWSASLEREEQREREKNDATHQFRN